MILERMPLVYSRFCGTNNLFIVTLIGQKRYKGLSSDDNIMMITRQKDQYVKEINCLRNEVGALKYKKYMSTNYGVMTFIFFCSLLFTQAQRDVGLRPLVERNLSKYGMNDVYELNQFDMTMLVTVYHYLVFQAVSHRFAVSVLMLGLMFMACIPGALQILHE